VNDAEIRTSLADCAATVEKALDSYLTEEKAGELAAPMRYAVLGGGKRIRAFLAMKCAEIGGAKGCEPMPAACAVEMIHAYSLVHDDMPCMDNDDMRRGKPSCHKAYGEATALLAGDTLLTYAFKVCAENPYVSPKCAIRSTIALADGAGALGMCGGQYIDIANEPNSWEELVHLHSLKTGALIKAACLSGYYCGTEKPDDASVASISEYALSLGLAFQIVDDLLDVTSTAEELGKPIGSDAASGKVTALTFMTIDEAKNEAERITNKAVNAAMSLYGGEALAALAVSLLNRKK
jgi:geranylgeranyl pyrophosphate synthase